MPEIAPLMAPGKSALSGQALETLKVIAACGGFAKAIAGDVGETRPEMEARPDDQEFDATESR